MPAKLLSPLFPWLILLTLFLIFLYSSLLPFHTPSSPSKNISASPPCDFFKGHWVSDPNRKPIYDETCPFHRNSWNCLRNKRDDMGRINSWKWMPETCDLPRIDPNIGLVGDSLNENFLVSFLCVLRVADLGAKKWKKKGAWRGAYFPKFNVTVAYHRAVLLAKYEWQPKQPSVGDQDGLKGINKVDVDIPADDWASIGDFYDVLVFNTGHWWGPDKFPKEKPLVFYQAGQPILPPLEMQDGLKLVLQNMVTHIQKDLPRKALKFWRLQSPRHFHGGDWNQNGSCLFSDPLEEPQLDLWFDPRNNGVNKEARILNGMIKDAVRGTEIQLLDLSHLSEFRADAHPAVWLGKKDAVAIWGQDCMHWCLPGVPDTWVDILSELISIRLTRRRIS
ncbi:hypothetical protein UlMin_042713 [Ulmus minor]